MTMKPYGIFKSQVEFINNILTMKAFTVHFVIYHGDHVCTMTCLLVPIGNMRQQLLYYCIDYWQGFSDVMFMIIQCFFFCFFFTLSFIFTSFREQDEAYINSLRWSALVGLEPAYTRM